MAEIVQGQPAVGYGTATPMSPATEGAGKEPGEVPAPCTMEPGAGGEFEKEFCPCSGVCWGIAFCGCFLIPMVVKENHEKADKIAPQGPPKEEKTNWMMMCIYAILASIVVGAFTGGAASAALTVVIWMQRKDLQKKLNLKEEDLCPALFFIICCAPCAITNEIATVDRVVKQREAGVGQPVMATP
eukprot:gene321-307_t